jgi:hypothetical protein
MDSGDSGSLPCSPISSTSDAPLIEASLRALGARGVHETALMARELSRGIDLRSAAGSLQAGVDGFIVYGDARALPALLREAADEALGHERDRSCPSGRLRAFIAAIGRAALNLAHCGVRNFASVALPTMVRQAIGRSLDLALAASVSETARTVLSCGCLAVPVVGQAVMLVRDEVRGDATRYSRATRVALMALPTGAGLLGAATGTLLYAGTRFAEVVLYPLMRDSVQARWPMVTDPDSGPTRGSLALAGLGYAINQLAVSRVFDAAPDADFDAGVLLPGGIALRGLGNWDTMSARGGVVAGLNQLYDSLLDDRTMARWVRPAFGASAPVAADWLTELTLGALTAPSYLFWTDPLHSRGVELQTLDEQRRGVAMPRQYAGNQLEPAVAGGSTVELMAFRDAEPDPACCEAGRGTGPRS